MKIIILLFGIIPFTYALSKTIKVPCGNNNYRILTQTGLNTVTMEGFNEPPGTLYMGPPLTVGGVKFSSRESVMANDSTIYTDPISDDLIINGKRLVDYEDGEVAEPAQHGSICIGGDESGSSFASIPRVEASAYDFSVHPKQKNIKTRKKAHDTPSTINKDHKSPSSNEDSKPKRTIVRQYYDDDNCPL